MKTFNVKIKVGDCIQLFENAYMTMMCIPIATGYVTQVRGSNDGFVFDCRETGSSETIAEGDGTVKILKPRGHK